MSFVEMLVYSMSFDLLLNVSFMTRNERMYVTQILVILPFMYVRNFFAHVLNMVKKKFFFTFNLLLIFSFKSIS